MEAFINDLRLAGRRLLREPIFTAIAIVTLAIGIGANSAIFTLVNGVLLRPLPFRAPSELVWIHGVGEDGKPDALSAPVFFAIQQRTKSFTDVAMFSNGAATLTGMGEAEQIRGMDVSASYFTVIGVKPLLGSVLPPDANETGRTNVVVLSESLWREKFGGERDVIGRSMMMNGRPHTIVGVMPQSASFPVESRYWAPLEYTESMRDPTNVFALWLTVVGRVKPGVSEEQANADVAAIMDEAEKAVDMVNPKWTAATRPMQELQTGEVKMPLLVLLGAVGLVLLIACANLANLLLAQAAARQTDFAVRRALGASPFRLVRQLLAESLALSVIGGGAGLLLGAWGADALVAMLPPNMPQVANLSVDWNVIAFTTAISLGAAALFGMAPALQVRQGALSEMLREGGRGLVSRGSLRTRAMLVVGETAVAFSLVIGAGLLMRSLNNLTHVNPGFRTENTLSFELSLPEARYEKGEQAAAFYEQLMTRLEAIPGVSSAGAIMNLPLGGSNTMITFNIKGRPEPTPDKATVLDVRIATPGYFETMGIPLKRGRLLSKDDRAGTQPVALLSEEAVRKFFPGEDPIGKTIEMGWRIAGTRVTGTVVGIVGGIRQNRLRESAAPEIYFPESQVPRHDMAIAVHTLGDPALLTSAFRDAVHQMDPNLALAQVRPISDVMSASVAGDRFMTLLLGVFSAMALLLAAVGIFGVISYGVTQRRREFGVRMAVGASRKEIVSLVLNGAVKLAGGGLIIGAAAAFALTRVLGALLFGVTPGDPITYIAGAAGLLLVALVASALPAWSASRLPPSAVLNTE